ncbi:MAG TPA: SUF system NifU family Fe-S cluster assembly protein [Oscillatoriaceae cyanobacterium]
MTNPASLYQEVILEHNKKPRNYGLLPDADHRAEGVNPLCGDHITLNLQLEGDRIGKIGFEGESCAICKASSSMMTTNVKGKTTDEVEQLIREFREMATGQLDPAGPHHLGRLTVFSGIAGLPSRVKCAVLPWHTLQAALHSGGTATTEGTDDPAPGSEGPAG